VRVALYHRVSTLDQNPELARDELRAAAKSRGGALALDVEETGSGAKNDRPGLARVMAAARAGAIDCVMVWKLDRFGRSALDLLANISALREAGVRFVATTQGIDVSREGGAIALLILTVLAGVAEFERELIRERTMLGLATARKKGVRLGRPTAELSPAAVSAARAARVTGKFDAHGRFRELSWREVRTVLLASGFERLPSHATIARACTKTPGEI
jgi:DNA invertase Pin-like site-specific DNA recombinase